jgi:heptosyltransferase III
MGRVLARLMGPRGSAARLQADQISTVLICRINGRMGNTLFLTPLLEKLHELLPQAAIDVALSYSQGGELLRTLPGVRTVICFPHKGGPGLVGRYFAALGQLRAQRYDLAIDPVPESTSDRVALSLCRARHRLGFANDSQWAPLTHAMPGPAAPMHQAVQPVFLLLQAFGVPYDARGLKLSLGLGPEELEAGRVAVARVMSVTPDEVERRAFGFFAHATASKTIERSWWAAFWQAFLELQPEAVPVEFLPGPRVAPIDSRFPSLHFPSTRALTAAMASTRMLVSADTGPMHLASSTSVPTVALFQATDPTLYGPLKPTDLAIDITASTPQLVAQRCQQIWRDRG